MAIDFDRTFDRTYLRYLRTVRNSTLTRDEIADMCAIYMAFDRAARALDRVTVSTVELTRQVSALQVQHSVKQAIRDAAQAAREQRRQLAQTGARERHARDPRQADKAKIEECWKKWQCNPERYGGKAAFARAMLDKYGNLKSQKKIEDWCRAWEKATVKPYQSVALRALIKKT